MATKTAKALQEIADKLVGVDVTELPVVTSADEGDVLKVNNQGKWAKGQIDPELPAVTAADEGDVLKVDNQGKWAKGQIDLELPTVTSEDAGKVLMVNESGEWVAAALPAASDAET